MMGAFHYAKVTGQRSVGIPEEKSGQPIEMALVILNFVTEFTCLSKMEWRISVGIFRPKYVDHLQR